MNIHLTRIFVTTQVLGFHHYSPFGKGGVGGICGDRKPAVRTNIQSPSVPFCKVGGGSDHLSSYESCTLNLVPRVKYTVNPALFSALISPWLPIIAMTSGVIPIPFHR